MKYSLKSLLLADLNRQFEYAGSVRRATVWTIMTRLLHPRFLPLFLIRVSRYCAVCGIPFMPSLCTYCNIVLFGLEVSSKCEIGPGLFLPHTSGTVIGASRIGKNATILQNVSVGATELDMHWDPALRPTIGDDVTLGAGCKVFGGLDIGDHVTVFANSVVLRSIPENSVAGGIPVKVAPRFSLAGNKRDI